MFIRDKDKLMRHIKFKLTINDKLDVCVKIFCGKDEKLDSYAGGSKKDSFYVFEPAYKDLMESKLKQLSGKIKDNLEKEMFINRGSPHK